MISACMCTWPRAVRVRAYVYVCVRLRLFCVLVSAKCFHGSIVVCIKYSCMFETVFFVITFSICNLFRRATEGSSIAVFGTAKLQARHGTLSSSTVTVFF